MTEELEFDLTLYPEPILRRRAEEVSAFDAELECIAAAMLRRMYASKGVGLAAPQVGLRKRLLVLNSSGDPHKPEEALVLVNPTFLMKSGPDTIFEEGCLSFPSIFVEIARPAECTVRAHRVDGSSFERTFAGFTSRIIQHEYDHLEGILLVDRMSSADRLRHKAALEALVARYRKLQLAAGKKR